jgi:hypothetical protein
VSATVKMALCLERNLDPATPPERSVEAFRRAFPGATRGQFEAALDFAVRAARDRIAAERADLAAVRPVLRPPRGER